MNTSLRTLGLITATISLVSLISSALQTDLSTVAALFLEYYRLVAHSIFQVPASFFGIVFPSFLLDLWMLSFVGAGAYAKTKNIEQSRMLSIYLTDPKPKGWRSLVFFIYGISFMGIPILFATINPFTYFDEIHESPLDLYKGAAANVLIVLVCAVIFFAMNALAPSLGT
tara:strand:- start:2771 stop:3280 length:510 start_codon:yes stop_codon:yes gene_type:complete